MSSGKRVTGTGGELLMHQLVAQEVDYAFTNTGSAEAGFRTTCIGEGVIDLLGHQLVHQQLAAGTGHSFPARHSSPQSHRHPECRRAGIEIAIAKLQPLIQSAAVSVRPVRSFRLPLPRNDGQLIYRDAIIPDSELLAFVRADHLAVGLPLGGGLIGTIIDKNEFPRGTLLKSIVIAVQQAME